MYILYRLVTAYLKEEININFFCHEYTLIYCRYAGIEEIEKQEFGVVLTREINMIFFNINELCSRYYDVNKEDIKKYSYTSEQELKEVLKHYLPVLTSFFNAKLG